jgi:hypothetical protein
MFNHFGPVGTPVWRVSGWIVGHSENGAGTTAFGLGSRLFVDGVMY